MNKNNLTELIKGYIRFPVYKFNCNMLDYTFTIEDSDMENLKKIQSLFLEYIHPNSGCNMRQFHYYIRNVQSEALVEKMYELKPLLGEHTRIQTFKDDTFHEAYFLINEELNVFFPEECDDYCIVSSNQDFYFICRKHMNSHLLRILREIYFRNSENLGHVVYHGGGFEVNKNGVMVCGDKAKGKTTVILEQLKKGSQYLSNDRVIVGCDNKNQYYIKYLPLSMRIGIGAINSTPQLSTIIKSYPWSRPQSSKVIDYFYGVDQHGDEYGSSEKLEITSKEIKDIFNVGLAECLPLKAIVFPDIDPNYSGMETLQCESSKAAQMILEQCMTPIDENWITPWLFQRNLSNNELKKHAEELTYKLVNNVHAYIIHFGFDAYRNWDLSLFL